jgi:long-chain acyl-CoA synthetase
MLAPIERVALALRGDVTLADLFDRLARAYGDGKLMEEADGGLDLTYEQAAKRIRRWSGGIAERLVSTETTGSDTKQVVVVAAPNGYEQLLLCFAAARAGAIPAPVNAQLRAEEVAHVVADSGATFAIRAAIEVDGAEPLGEPVPAAQDEVGALFYTSGTTGTPKGAALTHRALVGGVARAALWPHRLRRDEAVIALPIAHIMGFVVLTGLACAAIPTYLLPRFHPVRVLDAIESRRSTIFVGVPAMYRMLEEAGADERDLRSIRLWGSGADSMPAELADRFKRRGAIAHLPVLGPVGEAIFAEGYGMVETGGGAIGKVSPPFLGSRRGPFGDSLGMTMPGYSTRVVDVDGNEVAVGEVGELQLKGPGVLAGYWGDDDATEAALTEDGWLRTGDLARRGPLGLVAFEGRGKDVIKRGGYSVYALEVEQTLEEHPDVLEAAVLALPDDLLGEVPAAAVRLVDGASLDELDLGGWASERLAEYKVPIRFVAVDELHRTGTDKVQKRQLLSLFEES